MAPKGQFTLACAAVDSKKRPAEMPAAQSKPKVPKASECMVEEGPKPQRAAQRLPTHAPVVVCLYKVTDEACDVYPHYEGQCGVKLHQVQIQHEARPSVTFGVIDEFNLLLRKKHAKDEAMPASLVELQQKTGIKFVLTDRTDPDGVGFVQWRLAVYVPGGEDALNNFMFLLDEFFVHKSDSMARETPFEVHLHPHKLVNIADCWDELAYERYTLEEPSDKLPLSIFEAQPVARKRIVALHIQPETSDAMSILVTGDTWNFRSRLDAHGVAGAYYGTDDNRKYIRLLKSINVADKAQQDRVLDMVGDMVFKNLAIRVILDSQPDDDEGAVSAFVQRMREVPSLHFTS